MPVSVSDAKVRDGAELEPAANLIGPVIVVCPSAATELVISETRSSQRLLWSAAVMTPPELKLVTAFE